MTHEEAFLKAHPQLHGLIAFAQQASHDRLRIDSVERGLFSRLLQLGLSLLTAFVAQAGNGDVGDGATDVHGQPCKRLPEPHGRPYRSLFGLLTIGRFVCGTREGQKIQSVPLDATLGLPEGEFSYVLEEWAQRLCVQGSFAEAVQSLDDLLGLRPSVRSLENMNQTVADEAANFAAQRPIPPAQEEGELLVLTADHQGVILRPTAPAVGSAPTAAEPRQAPGQPGQPPQPPQRGKKKMACVGAVYTIARHGRTPQQILDELQRQERNRDRPRPCHKHVRVPHGCHRRHDRKVFRPRHQVRAATALTRSGAVPYHECLCTKRAGGSPPWQTWPSSPTSSSNRSPLPPIRTSSSVAPPTCSSTPARARNYRPWCAAVPSSRFRCACSASAATCWCATRASVERCCD